MKLRRKTLKFNIGQKKRAEPIKYEQVKFIGWRMSFSFRLKKVRKIDVIESLMPESLQENGKISLGSLQEVLKNMPFSLTDPKELKMFSEYLIEDEDNDEELEPESEQAVVVIKSIFNQVLGSYEGKHERDYENCNVKILELMDKKRLSFEYGLEEVSKEGVSMEYVADFYIRMVNNSK